MLVKIAAAGVNPVDTYIRSGTYARKPALPYTPGSDGAGVVHSVGEGVKQVKVSCFYEAIFNEFPMKLSQTKGVRPYLHE